MDVTVNRLKKHNVLYRRDTTSLSKFLILKAREEFRQNPPPNIQVYSFLKGGGALSTIFQLYRGGHFYWWANRSTLRKPLTCRKSLTNCITQCCIEYTFPNRNIIIILSYQGCDVHLCQWTPHWQLYFTGFVNCVYEWYIHLHWYIVYYTNLLLFF